MHERALAENEYYDRGGYNKFDLDEEVKGGGADQLAMKRRQERIEQKSEVFKNAFRENSYTHVVKKFQKTFDDNMRELLQVLTKEKRYETHIANLATRLDYNGYYSEVFNDIEVVLYPK